MDGWIISEHYGSSDLPLRTIDVQQNKQLKILKQKTDLRKWLYLRQLFQSIFLPQGYPESVSPDYLQYQIWDTIQAFSSSITGALATQAVLRGVGVGDEGATVMAATITWLLKDGMSMLGRILFAWFKGTSLDCHCKRWRLFADILNDVAIFLELLAPLFKEYFRFIVCLVGVCRSMVGVAGGATRAALTQHQARRNNLADVAAKDGSQETLVNLSALLCTLTLIPYVTGNERLIWTLFILFTCFHLYANYRAVTAVRMEVFNQDRLHITVQHYLNSNEVHSIALANLKEPVLLPLKRILTVKIGTSILSCTQSTEEIGFLLSLFSQQNEKYLLHFDIKNKVVNIILHDDCTSSDQLQAYFQAEILEQGCKRPGLMYDAILAGNAFQAVSLSYSQVKKLLPQFISQAKQNGWILNRFLFGSDEWRCNWAAKNDYFNKNVT